MLDAAKPPMLGLVRGKKDKWRFIVSKETAKYAINKDLSIESLYSFSSPQGDEFAFGVDYDQLMAIHPHAIALKAALARRGSTEYEYSVGYSRAYGPEIRICLTCENPDDEIGYSQEQFAIIEEAGLALYEGMIDETGDHALVKGRHADRAGVLCGVVEMSAQHTPGPWTVVAIDWAETGNARFEIKGIRRTGMADARLIAAAPDLLEALQSVLNSCLDSQGLADAYKQARAAIAKVEGGVA